MAYADKIIFNDIKYDKVYKGSELLFRVGGVYNPALSFTALENSIIRFVKATDYPEVFPINMQYRYEYENNFTDFGTDYIRLNKGEKIYVRGDNPNGLSYYDEDTELWKHSHFIIDLGKVEANGNIMSIIDGGRCTRMDVPEYCFYELFKDCTALVTAPALQAETLSNYCYGKMFSGCTSLINTPSLLSKTLAPYCYYAMFSGCTSLTTAYDLPATSLSSRCYCNMFDGCVNLNYVKCAANQYNSYAFRDWLNNVSPSGDFYCYDASIFPTGGSGIPSGWTVHSEV